MAVGRIPFAGLSLCGLVAAVALQTLAFGPTGAAFAGEQDRVEPPKLPAGYGNPKWDLKEVEERFKILKGGINEKRQVYFLLELKEDSRILGSYKILHIDKDGVAFENETSAIFPSSGKKGDRVRLVISNSLVGSQKYVYAKTATMKFVEP